MEENESEFQRKLYQKILISLIKSDKQFTPEFLDIIRGLYRTGHAMQRINRLTAGETIACVPGCAFCCRLIVRATLPELHLISTHLLKTYPPAEIAALRKTLRDFIERKKQAKSREDRHKIACGFLENNRCGIYNVRPFTCRAWNSNDSRICERYLSDKSQDIPIVQSDYSPFDIIRESIAKALYAVGMDYATQEINAGVLDLLESAITGQ